MRSSSPTPTTQTWGSASASQVGRAPSPPRPSSNTGTHRASGAYSPRKLFLVERNRIWLVAKYFPWPLVVLNPLLWLLRAALTFRAGRSGEGPWSQVGAGNRLEVMRAILAAQLAGWLGAPQQLRKRAHLRESCGADWRQRLRATAAGIARRHRRFARGEIE